VVTRASSFDLKLKRLFVPAEPASPISVGEINNPISGRPSFIWPTKAGRAAIAVAAAQHAGP